MANLKINYKSYLKSKLLILGLIVSLIALLGFTYLSKNSEAIVD